MSSWPATSLNIRPIALLSCFRRSYRRPPSLTCFAQSPTSRLLWHRNPWRAAAVGHVTHFRSSSAAAAPAPTPALPPLNTSRSSDEAQPLLALNSCRGCGAPVQVVHSNEAGYYSLSRAAVKSWLKDHTAQTLLPGEGDRNEDSSQPKTTGQDRTNSPPVCDRCHQLLHHSTGTSIAHPSLESIADTIDETPYKYNHVYHVLDAADFPMSLLPNIYSMLSLAPQRSQNRRARHAGFRQGRRFDISFIITRSDLLAPKKEQVDMLMPYLVEVLRDALAKSGKDVRLGNVRCVSSKRGWWTSTLKEDIRRRGGGGWMVGKVNVGKSKLFEVVFPKGSAEDINFSGVRDQARQTEAERQKESITTIGEQYHDSGSDLLPAARPETLYPDMPTVSSLPGTTASPIRIPFGGGKGELIDLPGLARSNLEAFVQPERRDELVMKTRISPEQHVVKPGQSLLLGGLFRITPTDASTTLLAYPFVPLKAHVTSTDKAAAIQAGTRDTGIDMLAASGASKTIASAGTFPLRWDVTRQRAGPLTSSSAVGIKAHDLPFQVMSTDILIESSGWVELVAQIRRAKTQPLAAAAAAATTHDDAQQQPSHAADSGFLDSLPPRLPGVEVFSPEGRFVAARKPMGAWLLGGRKGGAPRRAKARPRQSMRSVKRQRPKQQK